jgi:hypothetical protein
MKKLIFIISILALFFTNSFTQEKAKEAFQLRMNRHITHYIQHDLDLVKARELYGHTCDKHRHITDDDIRTYAAEAEKTAFIQANMAEYMQLYFPQADTRGILTDTFICDNGGFESDFLYYRGYTSTYFTGSNTCTPKTGGTPITYTPVTMPVTNRFEIMSTGTDPLVGIQKVKFGSKSLRINNRYGHIDQCDGDYGVDRVTKRFKVTEENRNFTVWYAVALENPVGHVDQQPFLNIKCDKAPADELCFDADFLMCASSYRDVSCTFTNIDVLDWACHRFSIPSSEIGNIATVEMIVADCGAGAHFGYAYIDGFCEPCTGSSLGSINLYQLDINEGNGLGINYYSCDGLTAQICGTFTLPTICGSWVIDTLFVPGYTIQNLSIDYSTKTFCFEFPLSSFGHDDCLDIYAEIQFTSGGTPPPPQTSNTIEICQSEYGSYSYDVEIGNCNSNGTADLLSDDYYFVTVTISDPAGNGWLVKRQLDDPYPNETGRYILTSGSGNATLLLGPFLIQEGCWDITITLPGCIYTENICPPQYCSGCSAFNGLKISNIQCTSGTPDTWSFDIYVPPSGSYSVDMVTKFKGFTYNIAAGPITQSCKTIALYDFGTACEKTLIICPPKPCSVSNCDFEVYPGLYTCNTSGFDIHLQVINPDNLSLCYKIAGAPIGFSLPGSNDIGSYTGNTQIVVYNCNDTLCFKVIYIPKPNCSDPDLGDSDGRRKAGVDGTLTIHPNPSPSDEIILRSDMEKTVYDVFSPSGHISKSGSFHGSEHRLTLDVAKGVYFVRYRNNSGSYRFIKILKL